MLYNSFTSAGAVATALNGMQDAEADSAKVVIEQFTPQLKGQKHTPIGQLRLDNQYIMFYLAPFAEATANACGSAGPTPTPTASSAATPTAASSPTPTQVPTAISSGLGGGTPTPTATAAATAIATLTPPAPTPAHTPTATPTQPCILPGGQCGIRDADAVLLVTHPDCFMCRGWRVSVPPRHACPDVRRADSNAELCAARWSAVRAADAVINARYQGRGTPLPVLPKQWGNSTPPKP